MSFTMSPLLPHPYPSLSAYIKRTPVGRNTATGLVSMRPIQAAHDQLNLLSQDVLRDYFRDPTNIVLHSNYPHITPHIVISPAPETPEDFYTPWNNCTLPQWSGFLMVPPYDLTTGRLRSPHQLLSKKADPRCASDDTIVNEDSKSEENLLISSNDKKHAFSRSQFDSFVSILHVR